MSRLDGRSFVITGGSRGIGLGIAQRVVDEGGRVCITGRNRDALVEAATQLGGGDRAIYVEGHAADVEHQAKAVEMTIERFGSVDGLVNNAGINPAFGPLMDLNLDTGRKTVEVNCLAALSWVQTCYHRGMRESGGAIVNITSVAGLRVAPGIAFYGATKSMLGHLTEELAYELAPTIRVNAVAPAVVKTKFASALYEGNEEVVASNYPLGRLGMPADVAGIATMLLSEDASWITGQTYVVDGGLTLGGGLR